MQNVEDDEEVTQLDQRKALRALALTEGFSINENGDFQFKDLKVTNIKINKGNNNIEVETESDPLKSGISLANNNRQPSSETTSEKDTVHNNNISYVGNDTNTNSNTDNKTSNNNNKSSTYTTSYKPLEFKKTTPGRSYLKFANKEEELEWIENNEFINRIAPFLYFLASTVSFLWAQAFYWWKRLPEEEQICVRDMFGKWFCETGELARQTLKNHPKVTHLGTRDTLVTYQLASHTGVSLLLAYVTTVVAKCFKRSKNAGDEPNQERVILLYYVSRFIVLSGLICQWGHIAIMDAKFKGILMANWAMDFRATIPYLACICIGIVSVFIFTLYEINELSKKYDTGVAMVISEK